MISKVYYTDKFIPERFAAYTIGFVVLIRPRSKNDVGLLYHELTHVKQFWHNPLMGLFYKFSKASRQKYEVEAYKVQLTYKPDKEVYKSLYAQYLSTNYNLDITKEQAIELLS
jgi:hypothetical protein